MSNYHQLSVSIYHQLSFGLAFGVTDTGTVRPSNEDNFLISEELGLVMVGDGMGGHEGGEIASASALLAMRDGIEKFVRDHAASAPQSKSDYDADATWSDHTMPAVMALFDAVTFTNTQLYAQNQAHHYCEGRGMGTTLTGLWQDTNQGMLVLFHVGDSRLYRWRDGQLKQLTHDHTLRQEALDQGQLEHLPAPNLLLQAIGPGASVKPEIHSHSYHPADVYLLCTDGLYGTTSENTMARLLSGATEQNLKQSCLDLIALAKQNGSRDNITAVLLLCQP